MKGDVSASRLACACVIIGCWQRHSGCKRGRGRWLQQMHGHVFRFPSFQEADEAKQRFPLATPPLKMHPFDGRHAAHVVLRLIGVPNGGHQGLSMARRLRVPMVVCGFSGSPRKRQNSSRTACRYCCTLTGEQNLRV